MRQQKKQRRIVEVDDMSRGLRRDSRADSQDPQNRQRKCNYKPRERTRESDVEQRPSRRNRRANFDKRSERPGEKNGRRGNEKRQRRIDAVVTAGKVVSHLMRKQNRKQ